jgi:hypothetical protein
LLGLTVVIGTIVASLRSFRRTRDQGFRFVVALFLFALVHGALDSNFARDGIETFIGALAISVVTFHAVPAIATCRNESVVAIDQGGEVKSFAFAAAGPRRRSDLNLLGR